MVQREVGERLAATPGSGAYGTPSVLAQLACEVEVLRAIPRTVFHPGAQRRLGAGGHAPARAVRGRAGRRGPRAGAAGARERRLRPPPQDARGLAGPRRRRRRDARASGCARRLQRLGHPADVARRAALARGLPRAGAGCSGCERARAHAARPGAGEGQPRPVRRPAARADGRHELASVMQSISLADELTLEPAPAGGAERRGLCPGVPGPPEQNLAAAALRGVPRARPAGTAPPLRLSIVKRIPVAAGLGGRLGRRGGDAAARPRRLGPRQTTTLLLRARRASSAPTSRRRSRPGAGWPRGAGERLARLPPPSRRSGCSCCPSRLELSTGERLRRGRPARPRARRRASWPSGARSWRRRSSTARRCRRRASCCTTTCSAAAVSLCPEIAADARARHARRAREPALLSGSGPTVVGLFARAGQQGLALARRRPPHWAGGAPRRPAPCRSRRSSPRRCRVDPPGSGGH